MPEGSGTLRGLRRELTKELFEELAALVQKLSGDVIEAYKCGLITKEEAVAELKSRGGELGVYTKT